jgi:hypothetical protein
MGIYRQTLKNMKTILFKSTVLFVLVNLSGCMALVLAPLAGGMASQKNSVTIDPATVSPDLVTALQKSKRIAVISNDPSVAYFAEHLERRGGYEITAEEPPKSATPSQRRTVMREVCEKKRPEMVISPSAGRSDAGTAATFASALIGRAIIDLSSEVDVLRCSDKWQSSFSAKIKLNQGAYNADQTKTAEIIGDEFAKAFLAMLGR